MPTAAPKAAVRRRRPRLPKESRSLWIATTGRYPRFHPLAGDLEVDVAVVGAGITGITAACLLKQAGRRVALLDAQRVVQGVTGYTTAHLTEVLDASFGGILSKFGKGDAQLAVRATRAALDAIAGFVARHRIECDFKEVPGFYYTENEESADGVREEYEAARTLGLRATLLDKAPLPFPTRAAVRFDGQARFHVRRYLLPLLRTIPGGGSHVFEDTRVVEVDDGEPCRVTTERGTITAADVVMATHVPLNKFFLQTKVAHYRSYVLACRVDDDVSDGLFWDDDDPYHYIRLQETKEGPLVIVGGEDHKVGQEDDTESCFRSLLDYARARLSVKSVAYRWSAQVAEPVDGLAYLGRNSHSSHVYVGTGYSGTGMTFGTLAAMISTDLILGRPNPWAELYDATRVKPAASFKEYVKENVDFPAHLVGDRLKKAEGDALTDVAPGEGKLLALEGHKRAVYRDEQGVVTVLDPVCTHLGCIVQFNDAEKSWDCPCHGSRFDTQGAVLNGPAVKPLQRKTRPDEPA